VGTNTEHMSYYEYTKTDLLTKEQRMQYDRIDDVIEEANLANDIWNTLDHDVTDTLDDDGTEMDNFRGALAEFCFRWVMGEKLPEQSK